MKKFSKEQINQIREMVEKIKQERNIDPSSDPMIVVHANKDGEIQSVDILEKGEV